MVLPLLCTPVHRLRHRIVLLLTLVALSVPAVLATGCGSTAHFVGGVAAHHAINHFATTPTARRRVNKVFCVYHGHRFLVDLRRHHVIGAGLNAAAAWRSCRGGFGRRQ